MQCGSVRRPWPGKATSRQQRARSVPISSGPVGVGPCTAGKPHLQEPWRCRAACDDATSLLTSDNTQYLDEPNSLLISETTQHLDDATSLLTSDNTQYLDRIHPEVAMWREAVYREREAVDKERETVKGILRREQDARDRERTAKWAAIKREIAVVHQLREECQKREAAEQREVRLQRMLRDANTQLLAGAGRLSMRGILEATQARAESKYPDQVAALQPATENSHKQKGFEAAWAVLFSHDHELRDKVAAATGWAPEQMPKKLDELRLRLANPLYTKSLKLIQESKQSVQLLQLKEVTDGSDVAALQCLCESLWFVDVYEMSVETYDRFAKALRRSTA